MRKLESLATSTLASAFSGPQGASPEAGADDEWIMDEVVIRPRVGWTPVDWSELLHFRELLFFLVWRDIKVRYKQTVLGVAWAVLQPLFTMVVFSVIFGGFARIP